MQAASEMTSDASLGIISMSNDWRGTKDAQRTFLALWHPAQPLPLPTPGCSKSPIPFFWSTGHFHQQCSDTCRDGILLNTQSTRPRKSSDTIKSDLNVDTRHFPPTHTKCPKIYFMISWFLFQVAFRKKFPLFHKDRAAPSFYFIPGLRESLPLLTHHLYS